MAIAHLVGHKDLELLDTDRNKKAQTVKDLKQELSAKEKEIASELRVKH